MTISLPLLLETINQMEAEAEVQSFGGAVEGRAVEGRAVRSHLTPKIGEYFIAKRAGVFFFDKLPSGNRKLQKILNLALSTEHNPVARYVTEHHAPAHEGLVTSHKAWAIICPRPDHWHVMAGPIIDRGQLVGAVGCTRDRSMPAFNTQNLADLSAVCLHLSVWITKVGLLRSIQSQSIRAEDVKKPRLSSSRLTSRELQIAELVAQGHTSAAIGTELWITENSVKQALKRMFRKLNVSSRAAMVAQLSGQLLEQSR